MSILHPDPSALDTAVFDFYQAKAAEDQARERRIACEARIVELIGLKDEGTTSVKTNFYKISTVQSITRTLVENYGEVLDSLDPDIFNAIVRHKPTLDVTALKKLATANPEAYRVACKAIIAKPGKPSVKLEIVEQTGQEAA
jgi:hypothetical protein